MATEKTIGGFPLAYTRVIDAESMVPIVGITALAYVSLEVINHLVLQGWLLPALSSSTALSATTVMGIYYFGIGVAIVAVGWAIWKLFSKQSE